MIEIKRKEECCGCNACGDACAHSAITFKTDIEGFWYPEVDKEKCVDCGLCEKVCPVIHAEELKKNDFEKPECFAANHKNLEIRFDSTSGGTFSALAENMYKDGGYVGGAIYDDNFRVKYFISNDKGDLPKLRSSKYLQSNSEGMYKEIKSLLRNGNKVLVCGLPCQIAALKGFLHKDYENLITVDLICRYINSPMAYRKYLDALEEEYDSKIVYIKAKNKELGWRKLTHKAVFANGKTYYGTFQIDKFMKASMHLNCLSRPSCYECPFKEFPRYGDITIGDYWTQKKNELDDDTGTSIVLINSQKGQSYYDSIKKKLKTISVPFEEVLPGNPALLKPLPKSSVNRKEFFDRIQKENFFHVVDDMAGTDNLSLKAKVRNVLKVVLTEIKCSQCKMKPLWQFVKLNFFHPAVQSNLIENKIIYTTPYCLFDLNSATL